VTDPEAAPAPQPFCQRGGSGDLFALLFPSAKPDARLPSFLFVPPFAEELNRSRRMVALQARALGALGHDVLVLDLYGTGDSAGDFADARWDIWLADIGAGIAWLKARGEGVVLWGLRLGAMLAAETAHRLEPRPALLLWQPVVDGRAYLNQFLRIRLAAGLARSDGGETTQTLRNRLAADETLEIAGYGLAPELAAAIEARTLMQFPPPRSGTHWWCEVSSDPERRLAPAGSRVIETWRRAGCESIEENVVGGEQFWATQEITISRPLLELTTRLFADRK
jgi:exosortase A-associated hydrolase 2